MKEVLSMNCIWFNTNKVTANCWCTKYGAYVTILPKDCTHCLDKVVKQN